MVGPLLLDTRARAVVRRGRTLELPAREYALLEYLARHAGSVVAKATLIEHVWESDHEPDWNAIEACVRRLRRKLDEPGEPSLIQTRRGHGYILAAAPSE
jgi:DNA-binding response OmpR family regulator